MKKTCKNCKYYEWNIVKKTSKFKPKYGRCFHDEVKINVGIPEQPIKIAFETKGDSFGGCFFSNRFEPKS